MANELVAMLLKPDMICKYFNLLLNEEIKAFEMALETYEDYMIPENQKGGFDRPSNMGDAFVNHDEPFVSILTGLKSL